MHCGAQSSPARATWLHLKVGGARIEEALFSLGFQIPTPLLPLLHCRQASACEFAHGPGVAQPPWRLGPVAAQDTFLVWSGLCADGRSLSEGASAPVCLLTGVGRWPPRARSCRGQGGVEQWTALGAQAAGCCQGRRSVCTFTSDRGSSCSLCLSVSERRTLSRTLFALLPSSSLSRAIDEKGLVLNWKSVPLRPGLVGDKRSDVVTSSPRVLFCERDPSIDWLPP